jgi:uncharacterized protein YkwD
MPKAIHLLIIVILITALIYQYLNSNNKVTLNITSPPPTENITATPTDFLSKQNSYTQTKQPTPIPYYTGVELWEQVQKYRREHGVPELRQDTTLCTIASIRVNQLLDLRNLDNHDGFPPLIQKYQDSGQLEHLNVAENILSGYKTATEAVSGWDSSLGHRALMQDGSFVWGCAAANYGFAVLIAAY